MTRFFWRLTGSMALNPKVYEDVEADTSATWQALGVVMLSSAAAGLGVHGVRSDRVAPRRRAGVGGRCRARHGLGPSACGPAPESGTPAGGSRPVRPDCQAAGV